MRGCLVRKYRLRYHNPSLHRCQRPKCPSAVLFQSNSSSWYLAARQVYSTCTSHLSYLSHRTRVRSYGGRDNGRTRTSHGAQLTLLVPFHKTPERRIKTGVVEQSKESDDAAARISESAPASHQGTRHIADGRSLLKLLDVLVKTCPLAVPVVKVQGLIKQVSEDQAEDTEPTIRIEVVHEEYSIVCERTVARSEQSQISLQASFEELVNEYVEKVTEHLRLGSATNQSTNSYPIRALYNTLELDQISTDVSTISVDRAYARNLLLYQVQVYSGKERLGSPQVWTNREGAWRLARASADADVLKRAEQAGLDLEALSSVRTSGPPVRRRKESTSDLPRARIRNQPRTYNAFISEECLTSMLRALHSFRGQPDEIETKPFRQLTIPSRDNLRTKNALKERSALLLSKFKNKEIHRTQKHILAERGRLPIREHSSAKRICRLVQENDVVVLVSETGSGKTTQLPQILLEKAILSGTGAFCNIVCTQPRRIAATSVAGRVAQEWGTQVGGSVGYHVRFDCKSSNEPGSIDYWTAGILLKKLQDDSEQILSHVSHIVVDEIHERDLTVDLLLSVLRDLMRSRKANGKPFPKLILMSATMKTIDFERYFAQTNNDCLPRVASITIPGRAYPVKTNMLDHSLPLFTQLYASDVKMMSLLRHSQSYLEWEDEYAEKAEEVRDTVLRNSMKDALQGVDATSLNQSDPFRDSCVPYSLMILAIAHILNLHEEGDILVFLPGMREIEIFADMLESQLPPSLGFSDAERIRLFKLHSALYQTNGRVFQSIPRGCRRIILATNIAQTSITLPNVVHVIDSGKRRALTYDQVDRRNDFTSAWIDKATSIQRKGRAGRVRLGYYWAMFSEARFQAMPEKARPDILTSDLTTSSLVLKSYSNGLDLRTFFAETLDVPDPNAVATCITELQRLGMLTHKEEITPLGKFCAEFPLHPAKARGLLLGALFGCFKPMLIIASHDSNAPLVHSSTSRKDTYHSTLSFADVADDDRYAFVKAFLDYDKALMCDSDERIAALEHRSVQPSAYRNTLTVARQLCEIMAGWRLLPPEISATTVEPANVFRCIPDSLDVNSDRLSLFKALGLGLVDTNLAVWDEDEQSWLVGDIKCMLKPYSVNTMQSLKLLQRPHHRQTGEIIGFSEMVRNVVSSPRPFLVESSTVTPLMAMLFGGPITLIDQETIEINGWLRYRIQIPSRQVDADTPDPDISPAKVIYELRKAIDRYVTLAFSDLMNVARMDNATAAVTKKINKQFQPTSIRDDRRAELFRVLDLDAEHWDEHILLKGQD